MENAPSPPPPPPPSTSAITKNFGQIWVKFHGKSNSRPGWYYLSNFLLNIKYSVRNPGPVILPDPLSAIMLKSTEHIRVRTIEITCKNSESNLKNWARFWDLNFFSNCDFTRLDSRKSTHSILKIQSSSFGFILIFISLKPMVSNIGSPRG